MPAQDQDPDSSWCSPLLPKNSPRLLLALAAILWCLTLVLVRRYYTESGAYTFLLWNLFLGVVPLGICRSPGAFGFSPGESRSGSWFCWGPGCSSFPMLPTS